MKTTVFCTKTYDRKFPDRFNKDFDHELTYFEASLNQAIADLTRDFEAVCVFTNGKPDQKAIQKLAILQGSSGFTGNGSQKS